MVLQSERSLLLSTLMSADFVNVGTMLHSVHSSNKDKIDQARMLFLVNNLCNPCCINS